MCLAVTGTPAPVIAKLQDTSGDVVMERLQERVQECPGYMEYLQSPVILTAVEELSVAEWLKPVICCRKPCLDSAELKPREIRTFCPSPQGSTSVALAGPARLCLAHQSCEEQQKQLSHASSVETNRGHRSRQAELCHIGLREKRHFSFALRTVSGCLGLGLAGRGLDAQLQ